VTSDRQELLEEIRTTDLAVYRAIAGGSTPMLDRALRRLSNAADRSTLWLTAASALAVIPGRPRRAAMLGVASIGVASATVNIVVKQLAPRRRPDRTAAGVPLLRQVRMPGSTSFPSGHSASAFAFASAVGSELPWLSLPLHLAATAVGYSRVHTGVHYPADVLIGAAIGSACAAGTTYIVNRMWPRTTRPS
jgi:membrane-associated phospholipid phosphatase